ncbi:MAG: glycosyltransferase [Myxococcota bacterium]
MLLSVCMIVKNEAAALPRALASLAPLRGHAEVVVVDTGSEDDTVAIARGHGAVVGTFAWTGDFAAARNASLARARGRFVLVLDADEALVAATAPELIATLEGDAVDALDVTIESVLPGDKLQVHHYLRVFRRYPDVAFHYAIHEQIWPSLAPHAPVVAASGVRLRHFGYALDEATLDGKRQRNLEAALRVLEDHPDDGYYLFHAGLAHLNRGATDDALAWLERALAHTDAGPARAPVLNAIAQAHYDRGDDRAAEVKIRASLRTTERQHHAWALLGDLLLRNDRPAEAADAFTGLLGSRGPSAIHTDFAPPWALAHLKHGLAALLAGDRDDIAMRALRRALDLGLDEPHLSSARRHLARGAPPPPDDPQSDIS